MSITVYRDQNANSVVIEGTAIGTTFSNELQAIGDDNGTDVTIKNLPKATSSEDFEEVSGVAYTEFVDRNGVALGGSQAATVNELNSIFSNTGNLSAPVITSQLTAAIVTGETLNYELTATGSTAHEWDFSNVQVGGISNITTVPGSNSRKIVGGSGLSAASYNIPMEAINYIGVDSQTLVLTVSSPAFSNTRSVQFQNNDYLNATASGLSTVLGRAGNGAGSGDAWTIALFFKAGTSNNSNQTIFYFGGNDSANESYIRLTYKGSDKSLVFHYGSDSNYLELKTAANTLPQSTWKHILVTYDGGTTGVNSGDIASYYGRFEIFIDGVSVSTTDSNSNYGTDQAINADLLRVGRNGASSQYMRNSCKVDELAVWSSDETANVSSIYNSGTPHDLSLLASAPSNWWRMGDGDTFPTLQDSSGSTDFTMLNMTIADIVNDVP